MRVSLNGSLFIILIIIIARSPEYYFNIIESFNPRHYQICLRKTNRGTMDSTPVDSRKPQPYSNPFP